MAVLASVLTASILHSGAAQPALKFTFDVDERHWEVWFNQTHDQCNPRDTVDQSMAAFRRDDGTVVAYSGDNDALNGVTVPGGGFFRMFGSSVNHLERDCSAPVLPGGSQADPASFPHSVWLMATWTDDGETVYGLVHDEYHANLTDAEMCPSGDKTACWYTTILAAKSTDGGQTFEYQTSPDNPRGIALSSPVKYQPGQEGGHAQGIPNHHLVHDPRDGFLYLLAGCAQGAYLPSDRFPKGGRCVWRTKDISDVKSWRGWDGEAWTVTSVDPYASPTSTDPTGHLPSAVSGVPPGSGSVVYHEGLELFITMGSKVIEGPNGRPIVQTAYMTSSNMTTWSSYKGAAKFELPEPYHGCAIYPHLIDADSPARNFDVIGKDSKSIYLQFITNDLRTVPPSESAFIRAGVSVPVTIEVASEQDVLAQNFMV